MQAALSADSSLSPDSVEIQLARIVASPGFRRSPRMRGFLQFVIQRSLANETGEINERSVGTLVCGRKPGFDPRLDPIVRVDAGRLRLRLREYYSELGREDPILIELKPGSYVPVIRVREFGRPAGEIPRSVAVLPFVNLTGKPHYDYLGDRLAEEVISLLAGVPGLLVASRTSAFRFRNGTQTVPQIAAALGVTAIVEGSFHTGNRQWFVTARLMDSRTGCLSWSHQYRSSRPALAGLRPDISAVIRGDRCLSMGR